MYCQILPDYVLKEALENQPTQELLDSVVASKGIRAERTAFLDLQKQGLTAFKPKKHTETRHLFDCGHNWSYPRQPTISETEIHGATSNQSNIGIVIMDKIYDFFHNEFGRHSFDNRDRPLEFYVNYGIKYNNAFWDGESCVFGDGDRRIFGTFLTPNIGYHEYGHSIMQYESNCEYYGQAGAINEHFSDVVACMGDQYEAKQTVDEANWLIGEGLFLLPDCPALRDMANPGQAYNHPTVGRDPQPAHMRDIYKGKEDNAGVHINSGILNRLFYIACMEVGGYSWDVMGKIWYKTIVTRTRSKPSFRSFTNSLKKEAIEQHGKGSGPHNSIKRACREVGI